MMIRPNIIFFMHFCAGIILGYKISFNFELLIFLFCIILFLTIAIYMIGRGRRNLRVLNFLVALLIFGCGFTIASSQKTNLAKIPNYGANIDNIKAAGNIVEYSIEPKILNSRFVVSIDTLRIHGDFYHFRSVNIQLSIKDSIKAEKILKNINVGNRVIFSGNLFIPKRFSNPGAPDYRGYMERENLLGYVSLQKDDFFYIVDDIKEYPEAMVSSLRRDIQQIISAIYSAEHSPMISGVLLGSRSSISDQAVDVYQETGVSHILAISGLHIGIILMILVPFVSRFHIIWRYIILAVLISIFCALAGMNPPAIRASMMFITIFLMKLSNRESDGINALLFSALILLLLNPADLYNVSFQLSFSAASAILILYPFLKDTIGVTPRNRMLQYFWDIEILTFSIMIVTLPFVVYHFNSISPLMFIANLAAIPLIFLIVTIAIISLVITFFSFTLSVSIAHLNSSIIDLLSKFLDSLRHIGLERIEVYSISWIIYILYFLAIITVYYLAKNRRINKLLVIPSFILGMLFLIYSNELISQFESRSKECRINFLDVGQGDCAVISFPGGTNVLIDGGNKTTYTDAGKEMILPFLKRSRISQIDYLFVSHSDADHALGIISVLKGVQVKNIYKTLSSDQNPVDLILESEAKKMNIPINYYNQAVIRPEKSAAIFILNSEKKKFDTDNDDSGLIKIVYGTNSILFTGDIGFEAEEYYCKEYGEFLDSDIIKISHHGSKYGSSLEFLKIVSPSFAVISSSRNNLYNHPADETLDRINNVGAKIFRTDYQGAQIFCSNGNEIKIIDWTH